MNYLLKRTMILNINKFLAVLFLFSFIAGKVVAGCDDPPGNEVDWNKCNFAENQEWSGISLAGAQMEAVNLSFSNLEKSQINNANMISGNFVFTNFSNSNLFSSNMQYANCNNANFDNSNLAKVNFEGANLFMASFKGANLFEVNLTGANITNAVFEEANLSNVIWVDGKKCALGSVGQCD